MRVVVLGGGGNFGARICKALGDDDRFDVVAAGRSLSTPVHPRVGAVRLDIAAGNFAASLAALRPQLVVHCIGPYQGQDYRACRASLAAGAHYLDLADGRAFVAEFAAANDDDARRAGRVAISGASTLPALSSAVVDAIRLQLPTLAEIQIAIAPGQQVPLGPATLQGVLSYAGRPFVWRRAGQWTTAWGWQELRRIDFAFGRRWAAACDVPDLALLPLRYPEVATVEFRAALEVGVQHFGLWLLAGLRRFGMPLAIERYLAPLASLARWFDSFGSDVGGMRVLVRGEDARGRLRAFEWQVTAPNGHGPEIPCMAAILLARRLAEGSRMTPGAYSCVGLLTLAEFAPEFARWGMTTAVRELAA